MIGKLLFTLAFLINKMFVWITIPVWCVWSLTAVCLRLAVTSWSAACRSCMLRFLVCIVCVYACVLIVCISYCHVTTKEKAEISSALQDILTSNAITVIIGFDSYLTIIHGHYPNPPPILQEPTPQLLAPVALGSGPREADVCVVLTKQHAHAISSERRIMLMNGASCQIIWFDKQYNPSVT